MNRFIDLIAETVCSPLAFFILWILVLFSPDIYKAMQSKPLEKPFIIIGKINKDYFMKTSMYEYTDKRGATAQFEDMSDKYLIGDTLK